MRTYKVQGMNAAASEGVGPALVEADSPEDARERFAAAEGTTLAQLEAAGLIVTATEEATA